MELLEIYYKNNYLIFFVSDMIIIDNLGVIIETEFNCINVLLQLN